MAGRGRVDDDDVVAAALDELADLRERHQLAQARRRGGDVAEGAVRDEPLDHRPHLELRDEVLLERLLGSIENASRPG